MCIVAWLYYAFLLASFFIMNLIWLVKFVLSRIHHQALRRREEGGVWLVRRQPAFLRPRRVRGWPLDPHMDGPDCAGSLTQRTFQSKTRYGPYMEVLVAHTILSSWLYSGLYSLR